MLGLKADSEKRVETFITEALNTRVVYFLKKDDGSADSLEMSLSPTLSLHIIMLPYTFRKEI